MNIKKAEERSGVSRQNIRFYEREGLLHPDRNAENDYREYHEEHIHTLKQIRAMRMLDMPLDQIRLVLEGKLSPAEAAAEQRKKLKERQAQLNTAIQFCDEWSAIRHLEDIDMDAVLSRMEQPENTQGLFQKWQEDYRKVVLSEKQKVFCVASLPVPLSPPPSKRRRSPRTSAKSSSPSCPTAATVTTPRLSLPRPDYNRTSFPKAERPLTKPSEVFCCICILCRSPRVSLSCRCTGRGRPA